MHLFRQHAIKDHAAAAALVPVIDYGPYFGGVPGALQRLADELRHACETVGFFYALNHGVPQTIIDRGFAASHQFHALQLGDKAPATAEREQYRLPADERVGPGGLHRAPGHQAEPERELFHQPRSQR